MHNKYEKDCRQPYNCFILLCLSSLALVVTLLENLTYIRVFSLSNISKKNAAMTVSEYPVFRITQSFKLLLIKTTSSLLSVSIFPKF